MTPPDEYLDPPEAKRYADALRGAREGDPHALDELVDELSPMLWRVGRSQGLDRSAAEDVVQSTWLSLMRKLSEIDQPAALRGWLATTARREAWRIGRKGSRETPADHQEWDGFAADQKDLGEDVIERMELAPRNRTLWNVVKQLPPRCRGLIQVIAYTDKPDYARIAEAMKMPRGSIGPSRGRCLAKLRELLHSNPEWNE